MDARPALLPLVLAALLAPASLRAAAPAAAPSPTQPSAPLDGPPLACQDFNAYVNGAWERETVLPPERARVGNFDLLARENERKLEAALAALLADPARQTSPGLKLLATAYAAAMDTAAIERQGLKPLAEPLARIQRLERAGIPALLGEFARWQLDLPLGLSVWTDARDPTRYTLTAWEGGITLPDREDYTRSDEPARRLRDGARTYAETLLKAAGFAHDAATLDALFAFEARLAAVMLTRVQRRDPNATYNRLELAQLAERGPGFDWAAWQRAFTGNARTRAVVLGNPAMATELARLVHETPLPTWQAYLRVRLLDRVAERLPGAFSDAHFAYRGTVIRGVRTPPPRFERAILAIGGATGSEPMGETLGELFASVSWSEATQKRANVMVEDIRQAMRQRIRALPWMSEPTKQFALAKLDNMVAQIGRPEQWRRYEGLELARDDHAGNLLRVAAWHSRNRVAGLDRPVNRLRWQTSPHIVNAFGAGGNRIVFPAGILQPPFFDPAADDATNYGAIGMVIGHEITHHFDDRGRQFDAIGRLHDWWTPADAAAYKQRADRVAALFDGFEPLPGQRVNGRQTLGEIISDFGGLQIAYEGLLIALARQGIDPRAVSPRDGLTAEQRFFTANALIWRAKQRDEFLINQLRTGQHSPSRYRSTAAAAQMPAFGRAFGCQPGDPMMAREPIVIW